ncbi:protein belonging to Hydrogenase expression/formation protein, HupF/HypC [Candidatus Magnetomorum sp. HK-1]|nr:protein belonging to Hydrogenase expression/formation protein, HupF/HypC [Candidatus Magnetomorum sp. HK-1]
MCLAIPSKVVEINDQMGTVDIEGVRRSVSFMLLEDVNVGDYVIVHAGFAIHTIDPIEAEKSIELIRQVVAAG